MIVQRGFRQPPSYGEQRLRDAPAGYFFDVMTNGFGAMQDYSSQVTATDQVTSTVDYGVLARRIVEIGTTNRVNLIERLAGLIVEALLREFPAREIRVRVRKLTPPLGVVGTPAVELTRSRS